MQTEGEANAIAWGLSDFNKSAIKILKSQDTILWKQEKTPALHECRNDEMTIFARGTSFEIGVEVSPSANWKKSREEFIRSWENQAQYLTLDIQIKCEDKIIPRETSYIQKLTQTQGSTLVMDQKIIKKTNNGLFFSTITSLRVPAQYLDVDLTLVLQLSVVVPSSQTPSNFKQGMGREEKEVRALLETGRYHPPYIAPREVPIPIRIIESLSIQCWSRNIDSWTSLNSVEIRNMHPKKDILIRHIGINLNASLRTEKIIRSNDVQNVSTLLPPLQCTSTNQTINELTGTTSVLLLPCSVPIEPWFNVVDLSHNFHQNFQDSSEMIRIKRGECHTIVYHISPRHVVNDSSLPSSSGIPPSALSGHFLTPVDVWWIECPETSEPSIASSLQTTSTYTSEDLSAYSEEDCIINTASLCWGIEKIMGREFAVEIDGPSVIHPLVPVELKLRISNLTSETRTINLFLQQPKDAHLFDESPPSSSALLDSEYEVQQQTQWRNSGLVNHHITVPIR
jgi:hypothetical protein